MIVKLIGKRRAITLGILLVANVAIATLYFMALLPMHQRVSGELASAQGEITSLQQKIQGVKQELDDYKKNLPVFQGLKNTGFFSSQDRFQLARELEKIREATPSVKGFTFAVSEIEEIPNEAVVAAEMRAIVSRIKLENVQALLDKDFYDLLDSMLKNFPAHIRLSSFTVTRTDGSLNEETLERIVDGEEVSLISAEAEFDWVTLIVNTAQPDAAQGDGQ